MIGTMTPTVLLALMPAVPLPVLGDQGGWSGVVSALLIAAFTHLAWPATVLTLACMFREAVRGLLGRIKSASSKYGTVTLESGRLAALLLQAETMANTLGLPQPIAAVRIITRDTSAHEAAVTQGLKAAAKRPRIVISDTWQFLVDSTCQLVEDRCGKRPATADVIAAAAAHDVDSATVNLVVLPTSIANVEIVAGSPAPVKDDAVRYVNLISRVHQRIAERIRRPDTAANRRDTFTGEGK